MNRRRFAPVAALTLALAALVASTTAVSAKGPTCADLEGLAISVHAQHIIRDYVTGGALGQTWPPRGVGSLIAGEGAVVPGGPGPGFHFPNGFAPGASFCLPQSQSPGFHAAHEAH